VGSWTDTLSFYVSYVVRRIFTGKRTKCTTRNEKNATASQPLNLVFHNRLNDLLKKFMLIGGMPEAVKTYIGNNMDFVAIQRVLSDITLSYIDDFTKYRKRPLLRLREVMGAVIKQNGGKFIYSKVGNLSNPAQAKEALDLLEMAGLVHKVFHTSGQGIPIAAEVNYKKFKAFLHDTGVFLQNTGIKLSEFLVAGNIDMLNKGNLAELFVATELVKYTNVHQRAQLYYWHREKRGSSAKIDFLIYSNQIAFRFLCLFFLPTTSLKNIVVTCYNAVFCFVVNKNNFA
jgi:predicted AAA+ superfamily ATPase